ncbi:hypothetical protein Dsin_024474 [Dipteronia sinensis]|uniref:Endonuclease/exonuclease/phosphatase domain-containing protein n=1 Tax=Dipteronia sinensis TaxID=43782 RepID=A0AAD9ZUB2_9ROSI|nr:hypothetical protein Dsin_024474 [Dipteronia sinensis]
MFIGCILHPPLLSPSLKSGCATTPESNSLFAEDKEKNKNLAIAERVDLGGMELRPAKSGKNVKLRSLKVKSSRKWKRSARGGSSNRFLERFQWRFSGFYGNPNASQCGNSWGLLRCLGQVDGLLWVVGGDFNDLLSMKEKGGGSDKSISEKLAFRHTVEDCDLIDLGFSEPSFTWNNKREGRKNIQERLDRFLADFLWRDRFPQVKVEHLGFHSSDHRPLLLHFDYDIHVVRGRGKGFKFKPFWLQEDYIERVFEREWDKKGRPRSIKELKSKLRWCAGKLSAWNVEHFGSLHSCIGKIQREIEELYRKCSDDGVMISIKTLERKLEGLLT